jgi:hypothetical protein
MNTEYIDRLQQSRRNALNLARALKVGDTASARAHHDMLGGNLDCIEAAQLRVRDKTNPTPTTPTPEPEPYYVKGSWADPRDSDDDAE